LRRARHARKLGARLSTSRPQADGPIKSLAANPPYRAAKTP